MPLTADLVCLASWRSRCLHCPKLNAPDRGKPVTVTVTCVAWVSGVFTYMKGLPFYLEFCLHMCTFV